MNKKDFDGYTLSIKQLIGYSKHFGFDDDDTQAVLEYCKSGFKHGYITSTDIADIVSFKDGIQMIPANIAVSARLSIKVTDLLDCSISTMLERAIIVKGVPNLICPDQDGKFTRLSVCDLSNAKVSICSIPLIGRVIVTVSGELGLIAYYNDEESEKYKCEMFERGVIPLDDAGFKLSGKFGLPIRI